MRLEDQIKFGLFAFIVVMFWALYMITTHSFGTRCKDAGYVGAEYTECVQRLANGGLINIE